MPNDDAKLKAGAGTGLRLLILAPDAPRPATNGLRMRMSSTLTALAAEGHRLVLLAAGAPPETDFPECEAAEYVPFNPAPASSARAWCGRARAALNGNAYAFERWRDRAWQARITSWLRQKKFDAIWCESPYPAMNLPWPPPLPLVVNAHNLEYRIWQRYRATMPTAWRSAYAAREARALHRREMQIYRQAALVLTCSRQEAEMLRRELGDAAAIAVAPNVISIPEPAAMAKARPWVLYSGGMDWLPNRDAVEFFGTQIWPRVLREAPEAEWIIAGREGPARWQHRWRQLSRTRFTGTQASLAPWLAQAAVAVVPLRIGAGTRFKILEAAAWERAIVSTRLGAEGLEFQPEQELELADAPQEFAAKTVALLRDPLRRAALGRAAQRRLRANYSPRQLRHALAQALARLPWGEGGVHGVVLSAGGLHAVGT